MSRSRRRERTSKDRGGKSSKKTHQPKSRKSRRHESRMEQRRKTLLRETLESQKQGAIKKIVSNEINTVIEGIREANNMRYQYHNKKNRFINIAFGYETILAMSSEQAKSVKTLLDRAILSRLYVFCLEPAKGRAEYKRAIRRDKDKSFFLDHTFYPIGLADSRAGMRRLMMGLEVTHYVDSRKDNLVTLLDITSHIKDDKPLIFFWGGTKEQIAVSFKKFLTKKMSTFIAKYDKSDDAFHLIDTSQKEYDGDETHVEEHPAGLGFAGFIPSGGA